MNTYTVNNNLYISSTMPPTSIITGITGQDGSYLAEVLIEAGHKVVGVARRCSHENGERIRHLKGKIEVVEGDVTDSSSMFNIISKYQPDYVYNLAAQSHVHTSFQQPYYTTNTVYLGALNILEAIRLMSPHSRYYQASSSEIYGDCYDEKLYPLPFAGHDIKLTITKYQDESTYKNPRSPYAIAKLAAYNLTRLYRDAYSIFATNGILFNHESPRRGENFVTRKITKYVAGLKHCNYLPSQMGGQLRLGNLTASRDWGYAKDYCEAMQLIIEHDEPDDFVVGTGQTYTVRDCVEVAFDHIGITNWQDYVSIDQELLRPSEVPFLRANPSKAERVLGWKPQTSFQQLIEMMVEHDFQSLTG